MAFLLTANSVFSMDHKKRRKRRKNPTSAQVGQRLQRNDNRENKGFTEEAECSICQNTVAMENFHILTCNHGFCKTCLKRYLAKQYTNKVAPSCPNCTKMFVSEEYDKMSFCSTEANNLKIRYAPKESEFQRKNKSHRRNSQTISSIKAAIKVFAIPAVLIGYGLYRFYKDESKKPANNQSKGEVKEKSQSWLSKTLSKVKQSIQEKAKTVNKSDILVPALVGTGLFTLLTAKRTNLYKPIKDLAQQNFGFYEYNNFMRDTFCGKALSTIILNKHAINATLSFTGGLMAGCLYKLFSGENYKPKKQPQLTLKNKNI